MLKKIKYFCVICVFVHVSCKMYTDMIEYPEHYFTCWSCQRFHNPVPAERLNNCGGGWFGVNCGIVAGAIVVTK